MGAALGHRGGEGASGHAEKRRDRPANTSGINILILWGAAIEHGFTGQSWLTFRQALSLGGHVRKGERGTTVVYADRFVPVDEKRARTRDRRRSTGYSIPEALHRFQPGSMRRAARRS